MRLVVYGTDRPALLADIAKAIAATRVNIRTRRHGQPRTRRARGVFVVEVPNLRKLHGGHAGGRSACKGVTRVERQQRLGCAARRERRSGA